MSKIMRCDKCGKELPWMGNGSWCVLKDTFIHLEYDLCDKCFQLTANFLKKDGGKSAES